MKKIMQWGIKLSLGLSLGLSPALVSTTAVSHAATNDSAVNALLKVKAPNWSKSTAKQKETAALKPYGKRINQRLNQYKQMAKTKHYKTSNDKQSATAYVAYTYVFASSYKKLTPSYLESVKSDLAKSGAGKGNYTKAAVDYAVNHVSYQVKQAVAYNQKYTYPEYMQYLKNHK